MGLGKMRLLTIKDTIILCSIAYQELAGIGIDFMHVSVDGQAYYQAVLPARTIQRDVVQISNEAIKVVMHTLPSGVQVRETRYLGFHGSYIVSTLTTHLDVPVTPVRYRYA